DLSVVLGALGGAALRAHDDQHAITYYERAIALLEHAFGANANQLIDPLHGLGEAYRELGEVRRAIALAERASQLAQQADDATVAEADFVLAKALRAGKQDPARAEQLARDAIDRYGHLGRGWAA